jgi:hypothetical protein
MDQPAEQSKDPCTVQEEYAALQALQEPADRPGTGEASGVSDMSNMPEKLRAAAQ